jgi:VanZ family protein
VKRSYVLHPLACAIAALAIYWLALFAGTHVFKFPRSTMMADKFAHFFGYLGLAFLLSIVLLRRSRWSRRRAFCIWGGVILYGLIDEMLQIPAPQRTADVWDWVADSLGAMCGIVLFRMVQRSIAHRRSRGGARREAALDQR